MLAERTGNVHMHKDVSEEEFVAMRTQRDATLEMPKLILPSIQVNMRGGPLPEPEDNGVSLPETAAQLAALGDWPCWNRSPRSWRSPAAC